MESETIIIVSLFSAAWVLLCAAVLVMGCQVSSLKKQLAELQANGRLRVQKLTMDGDKNHAFHNPVISPDEELSRRGYSMYVADEVEGGRANSEQRQTGGQLVEELTRELETRHQQQQHQGGPPPPFLLSAIEDSKRRSRTLANPVANPSAAGGNPSGNANPQGQRVPSETNPNFIY